MNNNIKISFGTTFLVIGSLVLFATLGYKITIGIFLMIVGISLMAL